MEADPIDFIDPQGLYKCGPALCPGDYPSGNQGGWPGGAGGGGHEDANLPAPDNGGHETDGGRPDPKFLRDLAAAGRNRDKIKATLRAAVPEGRSSADMIDCMAGLESTWNPLSDGPGTRTGLFQYDRSGWEGDTSVPYSVANVRDIALSVAAALQGLQWRYEASVSRRPERTQEQHLARPFSLFNGEFDKYGKYGYGMAILECAKSIAKDFTAGFRSLWHLTNK